MTKTTSTLLHFWFYKFFQNKYYLRPHKHFSTISEIISNFVANFSSHARGVAILIHKSIPFQVNTTTLDPGGRFIILQGTLFGQHLILVNIYGPNKDEPQFYNNIFLTLASLRGDIIIGGDFNCALNPDFDRNGNQGSSHNQSRKIILNFMGELGLCDVWRERNPDKREFSCYSTMQKTFTRLDFFLFSKI